MLLRIKKSIHMRGALIARVGARLVVGSISSASTCAARNGELEI